MSNSRGVGSSRVVADVLVADQQRQGVGVGPQQVLGHVHPYRLQPYHAASWEMGGGGGVAEQMGVDQGGGSCYCSQERLPLPGRNTLPNFGNQIFEVNCPTSKLYAEHQTKSQTWSSIKFYINFSCKLPSKQSPRDPIQEAPPLWGQVSTALATPKHRSGCRGFRTARGEGKRRAHRC